MPGALPEYQNAHFIDEETEVQRAGVACQLSQWHINNEDVYLKMVSSVNIFDAISKR